MDINLQARIQEIVQKNDKIAIAVGKDPSLDSMAAALSLQLGLDRLGKKSQIASPSQPLVAQSSLVGIDRVKSQLTGEGGDLIASFPYREGEIEKVSYTIENGFLNIVVKAGEQGLQFKEQDVRYSRSGGVPQVLFIVGTARLSDLGSLFNPEALKDTTIINIDNKIDNQGFGDVVFVNQTASSVSEMVGEILTVLGADIDIDTSQNLLSGITFATENFQSPKTTSIAFEMAANFMKKGAKRQQVRLPQQNEERVSSFMPEQMLSQGAGNRGVRNPFLTQPAPQPGVAPRMPMPPMPQRQQQAPVASPFAQQQQMPSQMPSSRPMPQPFPRPQVAPMQSQASQPQYISQPPVQPMPQRPQVPQMSQPPMPSQAFEDDQDVAQNAGQPQKPPSDWLTPKVYKGSSNV